MRVSQYMLEYKIQIKLFLLNVLCVLCHHPEIQVYRPMCVGGYYYMDK